MSKLRLQLDDLAVESFDTSPVKREKGTVFGELCTCATNCTCPGCPTCDHTCAQTCDDATCPNCPTCAASCNGTCDGGTCGCSGDASCNGTCDASCNGTCWGCYNNSNGWPCSYEP